MPSDVRADSKAGPSVVPRNPCRPVFEAALERVMKDHSRACELLANRFAASFDGFVKKNGDAGPARTDNPKWMEAVTFAAQECARWLEQKALGRAPAPEELQAARDHIVAHVTADLDDPRLKLSTHARILHACAERLPRPEFDLQEIANDFVDACRSGILERRALKDSTAAFLGRMKEVEIEALRGCAPRSVGPQRDDGQLGDDSLFITHLLARQAPPPDAKAVQAEADPELDAIIQFEVENIRKALGTGHALAKELLADIAQSPQDIEGALRRLAGKIESVFWGGRKVPDQWAAAMVAILHGQLGELAAGMQLEAVRQVIGQTIAWRSGVYRQAATLESMRALSRGATHTVNWSGLDRVGARMMNYLFVDFDQRWHKANPWPLDLKGKLDAARQKWRKGRFRIKVECGDRSVLKRLAAEEHPSEEAIFRSLKAARIQGPLWGLEMHDAQLHRIAQDIRSVALPREDEEARLETIDNSIAQLILDVRTDAFTQPCALRILSTCLRDGHLDGSIVPDLLKPFVQSVFKTPQDRRALENLLRRYAAQTAGKPASGAASIDRRGPQAPVPRQEIVDAISDSVGFLKAHVRPLNAERMAVVYLARLRDPRRKADATRELAAEIESALWATPWPRSVHDGAKGPGQERIARTADELSHRLADRSSLKRIRLAIAAVIEQRLARYCEPDAMQAILARVVPGDGYESVDFVEQQMARTWLKDSAEMPAAKPRHMDDSSISR
jgi:hypothetical protein